MPAIIRQRLLRSGEAEYSLTSAADQDQYLVVVDSRVTKATLVGLFVAYPGNPVPKLSFKTLGAQILICDSIKATALGSTLWRVVVPWKEIGQEQPDQSPEQPQKANNSTIDDWEPGYSVRTEVIFEEAAKAYYVSGFVPGQAATKFEADATGSPGPPIVPPKMSVMANSAFQPFTNNPQKRRRIRIYSVRWVQTTVPAGLLSAEGKINSLAFATTKLGYAHSWAPRTALLNSISWSPRRWRDQALVGIEAEIIVDPETWLWVTIDAGMNARYTSGDPDGKGGTLDGSDMIDGAPRLRALKDANGKAVSEPVLLDGDGQPLNGNADAIEITWRGYEEVDFDTVTLLQDL